MPLFEVAIISVLTEKEKEEGKAEELVLAPTAVVAKDRDHAMILAAQRLAPIQMGANIKVLVRPFV